MTWAGKDLWNFAENGEEKSTVESLALLKSCKVQGTFERIKEDGELRKVGGEGAKEKNHDDHSLFVLV